MSLFPPIQVPIVYWSSWFCSGSFQTSIIAKIAGPGRKRHNSDPDPSSGSDSGDGQPVSAKCLKMSSSGASGVAGSDAVGRRGGSQQRRGSGRETSSDLSSSTSKKKQKDKANQESREAKRAAAVVDGVIAEVKRGKEDCRLYIDIRAPQQPNQSTGCSARLKWKRISYFLPAVQSFSLVLKGISYALFPLFDIIPACLKVCELFWPKLWIIITSANSSFLMVIVVKFGYFPCMWFWTDSESTMTQLSVKASVA